MLEKYEASDDDVYRPENFAILKYCYENYEYNSDIDAFIEKVSAVQQETNILQEAMEEEIDETMSSLDEKNDEESEEQKEEEQIATRAHLLLRVTLQLIHCLIPLHAYRRMIAMMIVMIPLILLKYPFSMMLAMLVAKMPI